MTFTLKMRFPTLEIHFLPRFPLFRNPSASSSSHGHGALPALRLRPTTHEMVETCIQSLCQFLRVAVASFAFTGLPFYGRSIISLQFQNFNVAWFEVLNRYHMYLIFSLRKDCHSEVILVVAFLIKEFSFSYNHCSEIMISARLHFSLLFCAKIATIL